MIRYNKYGRHQYGSRPQETYQRSATGVTIATLVHCSTPTFPSTSLSHMSFDDSASTPHYKRTSPEQRQGTDRGKVPRSGGQSNAPGTRPEEQPGANGLVDSYQGQVRGQPSVVPWGSRLGLCFPPALFLRMIRITREVQLY